MNVAASACLVKAILSIIVFYYSKKKKPRVLSPCGLIDGFPLATELVRPDREPYVLWEKSCSNAFWLGLGDCRAHDDGTRYGEMEFSEIFVIRCCIPQSIGENKLVSNKYGNGVRGNSISFVDISTYMCPFTSCALDFGLSREYIEM